MKKRLPFYFLYALFFEFVTGSSCIYAQGITNNSIGGITASCMNTSPGPIIGTLPGGGTGTFIYLWQGSTTNATSGFSAASGTNNARDYSPAALTATTWYRRIVFSGSYADTSVVRQAAVYPKPNVGFKIDYPYNNYPLCISLAIGFRDTTGSQLRVSQRWNFGFGGDTTVQAWSSGIIYKNFPSPGTYQIKLVENFTTCVDSITRQINILPEPVANISLAGNRLQCYNGNSFSFSDSSVFSSGLYARKWLFGSSETDTSTQANPVKTYTSNGTYIVKLEITANNGCKTTARKQVDVLPPLSNNSVSQSQTICRGALPLSLNGTVPYGGATGLLEDFTGKVVTDWWGTDGIWIPQDFGWSGSPVSIWRYGYNSYNRAGPYEKGIISSLVSEQSPVRLTSKFFSPSVLGDSLKFDVSHMMICCYNGVNNPTICYYDSLIVYVSGGAGFTRIKAWGSSATVDTINGITTKSASNTYSGGNSLNNWALKKLALPVGTIQVRFEFYRSGCNGGIHIDRVSIDPRGEYNYQWQLSSTSASDGFSPIPGGTGANYSPTLQTQSKWYRRVVSMNGCADTSAAIKIEVSPAPGIYPSGTINFCSGGSLLLNTDTGAGLSYQWKKNESSIGTNAPNHNAIASGNYKVIVTHPNNCIDSSDVVSVTEVPNPLAGFTVNNSTQCLNDNSFLFSDTSVISSGMLSTKWDFGNGSVSTAIDQAISYANAATYTIKLISTSNNNCKDSITKTITVHPHPLALLTSSGNTSFCFGDSVMLSASPDSAAYTYKWFLNDTNSISQTTSTFVARESGNIKVQLTSANGCSDSSNAINIVVNPLPTTSAISGDTNVNTNTTRPYSVVNTSGSVYTWMFSNGSGSSSSNSINITWISSGNAEIKVFETSTAGCNGDTTRLNVQISSPVGIESINKLHNDIKVYPNPFTDFITLRFTEEEIRLIEIFDLRGRKVFSEKIKGQETYLDLSFLDKNNIYILRANKAAIKLFKK